MGLDGGSLGDYYQTAVCGRQMASAVYQQLGTKRRSLAGTLDSIKNRPPVCICVHA